MRLKFRLQLGKDDFFISDECNSTKEVEYFLAVVKEFERIRQEILPKKKKRKK